MTDSPATFLELPHSVGPLAKRANAMRLQILTSAEPAQEPGTLQTLAPNPVFARSNLQVELIEMCEAMAQHAMSNGCELSP